MSELSMKIRPFSDEDEDAVIELWKKCNLTRPQNKPRLDIKRKLKVNPELFLIGELDGKLVATVMGGYEGHRGWINYLGVDPDYRHLGFGRQIMNEIERLLLRAGCPKINLQIRKDNIVAMDFYRQIGYVTDDVISMGKRIIND